MLVETEAHFLEDSKILSHSTGLHLQRSKGLALQSASYFHCPVQSSLASPEGQALPFPFVSFGCPVLLAVTWGPPSPDAGCRDLV